MFPAWSPDGRRIAFASDRTGDYEIYVANADGSQLKRLTDAPGRDAHPSWSTDGKTLLFQSPRENGDTRIFQMNADGSGQHSLAESVGFCGVASWSPDQRHVAFQCTSAQSGAATADSPWRLYLLHRGSRTPRVISHGPGNDQVPEWSRDGRKLLFFSDRSGTNELYELNLRRHRTRQLTFGPYRYESASWSPADRRIAVRIAEGDSKGDIYVLGPGTRRVRITDNHPQFGTPAWSRDGKRLLLQLPTPDGWRLFVAPSDGSAKPRMIELR